MIERRQMTFRMRADDDYREAAGYDTIRVPLNGATGLAVTAWLLSATWIDLSVKRAHAGGAPEAFPTPIQLTTGARTVVLDAGDLSGAGEVVITPASHASGHRVDVVVTLEVETSPADSRSVFP